MNRVELRITEFFDILLTRSVLTEIVAVAGCMFVGWAAGLQIRRWYALRGHGPTPSLTWAYLSRRGSKVVAPFVVALLLLLDGLTLLLLRLRLIVNLDACGGANVTVRRKRPGNGHAGRAAVIDAGELGALNGAAQSTTCEPSSTTRFGGRWK